MANTQIACVQMDVAIGDVTANRQQIIAGIREAAAHGAQLVIFPECALTGYCFESLDEAAPFAEPLDGPSAQAIAAVCHDTGTHIVAGFIERQGDRYYNAAMVIGPAQAIDPEATPLTFKPVETDEDLREAGLTSLDMVSLVLSVESEFGIKVPEREITPANFRSIATIETLVARLSR